MTEEEQLGSLPPVQFDDSSVEGTVHALVERGSELHVSDIFLASHEAAVTSSVRHLGVVRLLNTFSLEHGKRLINYVKAMSGIDIAEHRRPQDGRWVHQRPNGSELDLRVSVIPTLYGEDVDLRLLDRETCLKGLDELGLLGEQYEQLLAMLNRPSGLILASGPTGCGKTTTLYSCLQYLNNGLRKINTIEDPVEYTIEGLRQSQVNERLGVDFSALLPSVLRQSPDVIMIGEIRDPETAQIAVRAANSGHLVLATLHATQAAGALQSMQAYGIKPHFLSTSLLGILSQRLLRVLCAECRRPVDLRDSPEVFADVRDRLAPGQGTIRYKAGHCAACHETGYIRREGVFEVLAVTPRVRRQIAQSHSAEDIQHAARAESMLEMHHAALLKAAQGDVSVEDVFRNIPCDGS